MIKRLAGNKPELPILFVGGENDPCIGSRRKFGEAIHTMEEAGYRNVKGHLYPGMRHEILNETGRQQVFREIRRYLSKRRILSFHNSQKNGMIGR